MRDTSWSIPNFLTSVELAALQSVFERVCDEFGFGENDRTARDRIAAALMAEAQDQRSVPNAEGSARAIAVKILRERGQ